MAEQVTARGVRGVVAAAAPLAAQAGLDALRAGGNAFDAVVAAGLAETVLLPPKCGLGGDLIALVRHAGAAEPVALLAIGGAPAGLAAVARGTDWRDVGPNSVGPPAAPRGYQALSELGRLGRPAQAAAAIRLAREGFPWAAVVHDLTRQSAVLLREMNPAGTAYLPGDEPIAATTLTRLPGLADVVDAWVDDGGDLLAGPVGAAIVAAVAERGGVLTADDLATTVAEWVPAVCGTADDRRIWATPAPTHGPSLVDAATRLGADRSPVAVHAAVAAAIAARGETLADPSGTSMVSAADADGNVAVVIHSNSYPRYGSGIVVPGYDLVLANRAGRGFTPVDGHPNFPVAGRRPATTLHAWAVSDAGDEAVRLMGATPGGANQMPWNAQAIARILDGCEQPGELVTAPLWESLAAEVRIEGGFDAAAVDAMTAAGWALKKSPRWACRSAQQVVRIPRDGEAWAAAADPRTQGLALASPY